jgi:hypothetical protein
MLYADLIIKIRYLKIDIEHYVKKLKEHEEQRLSTNERTAYWKGLVNGNN